MLDHLRLRGLPDRPVPDRCRLFRDRDQSGGLKAIWIIALIVFPLITSVIYLIVRGKGMAERQVAQVKQAKADSESYIREVAGRSPAQEIADAKALLDSGAINATDFEKIKTKALA